VGLWKQAAGVERDDIDIQALAENGVADGLVVQTEAGCEHQHTVDRGPHRGNALEQVERWRRRREPGCQEIEG
jgi:hypothetical protein